MKKSEVRQKGLYIYENTIRIYYQQKYSGGEADESVNSRR